MREINSWIEFYDLGHEMCLEFPMMLISMIAVVETPEECKHFITQERINNHL